MFLDDGDNFRLVSDQASQAIMNAAEQAASDAFSAKEGAEAARDIVENLASDAVSQGNVPIYSTLAGIAALEIPASINAIRVNGRNAVGDGEGGLYIASDNGSDDTGVSGDGRTWWRVKDVGGNRTSGRLLDDLGNSFFKNKFKKRIIANIPSAPPTYQRVLNIETESTIFIAQGMCLDRADNKLYIIMSSPGSGKNMWVFVYKWGSFEYLNTFGLKLTGVTGGEGIEVIRDGNRKYVYARTISNGVERFDITIDPSEMTIIHPSDSYINGAGGQISYRNGAWLVRQWAATTGNGTHNNQFHALDGTLTQITSVKTFDPLDVGVDVTRPGYKFVPKIQGMILGDGFMFAPMGGASGISGEAEGYGYCGIRIFDMSSNRVCDNLLNPIRYAQKLISMGIHCTRMEYEGAFQDVDGKIYSLAVIVNPGLAGAEEGGMLIAEEYATGDDAIDFIDCTGIIPVPNRERLISGVYPVDRVGVLRNPFNGEILNSWDSILTLMSTYSLPRLSYFSSIASGIVDINGEALPPSSFVEIYSANDDTFVITIFINGAARLYRIYGNAGNRVQAVWAMPLCGQFSITAAQAQSGYAWYPSNGSYVQVGAGLDTGGSITLSKRDSLRGDVVEIKRGIGSGNLEIKNSAGIVIQTLSAGQIGKCIMGGADWYSWSVIG